MQKGQVQIILIGVLVIAIALAGGLYLGRQTSPKPTPTPVVISQTPQPSSSPISDETANWKTYTNTKYTYSVRYPSNLEVKTGGYGQLPITEESNVIIDSLGIKTDQSGWLSIRVVDKLCQGEPNNKSISIKGGLKSFADKIWQLNNNGNPLQETTIDGQKTYQFFTKNSWSDDCGETSLNQENRALITEKSGLIYLLLFPTNNQIYLQILSTFRFIQ